MLKKFIQRPVLSIVISLVIVFMGILAIKTINVSQFPNIAPTLIEVTCAYPGASANVLTESVLVPLEQSINGVQDMKYMTSDATAAGEANIQIIFNQGTNPTEALVNVQNRVNLVLNRLPEIVQREGVLVNIIQPSMLMYINLYSNDPKADEKFLYNYANVNVLPEIQRTQGIAKSRILGSRTYAMRIWLKPDRMRAYNISSEEVMKALDEQSVVGSIGSTGIASGKHSQSFSFVLKYPGRFNKVEQYENVVVRARPDGEILHLKDIADVELGSEFYDIYSNYNGHPSAAIVLKQTANSNATEVIENVKQKLETLKQKRFPPGMEYSVSYDVSKFIEASTEEVVHTLVEAFILVAFVVYIFLGDWRSTLIPTLAIPVSLIGTFLFMELFGLTINMITLFALVLAIGIVVDDAIVVVEAVNAKMEEDPDISPFRASRLVIQEIGGAIIAITLVMISVFVPLAFMSGPTGMFYRQFSITMSMSIILSATVALSLTPVLCAIILKQPDRSKPRKRNLITRFLDGFNHRFEQMAGRYAQVLSKIVTKRLLTFLIITAFGIGILFINKLIPAGFIPSEDQGMIYAIIQTPPGTTLERTNKIADQLQQIALHEKGVNSVSALAGYEILTEGRGTNAGSCLINLDEWAKRGKNVSQIVEDLEKKTKSLGAKVEFFQPPAVPGYGSSDGWAVRLLDQTGSDDVNAFEKVNNDFMAGLAKRKELSGMFTFFSNDYPQYDVMIDNNLAMQKGVSIGKALDNLGIYVGSTYDLGFIKFNRYFKVYVQAAPQYRALPKDIMNLYVKNDAGGEVPYSAFMKMIPTHGMNEMTRYNMYPSAAIRGMPAKGYSSGDAIKAIQEVAAKTLPRGYDIGWEGITYDQVGRGGEAAFIFLIVLMFVYFVLAAQYESFILPLAVILSLPVGIFGAFCFLKFMGVSNDIYAQVGMVMLIGLLGKNAVLIVEFASHKFHQGSTIRAAAIEGARVRLRPILMTSFAFVAGLLPLIFATGPGAKGEKTIGSAAVGGMLFGTIFGVFIIPGLYYIFGTLASKRKLIKKEDEDPFTEEIDYNKNDKDA